MEEQIQENTAGKVEAGDIADAANAGLGPRAGDRGLLPRRLGSSLQWSEEEREHLAVDPQEAQRFREQIRA